MTLGKVPLRSLVLLLVFLLLAAAIGLQNGPALPRSVKVVDVQATVPEAGGFTPAAITVRAGQRVRLRFHAADVPHGVAIGPGLGIDLGDLNPGEVRTVDVTFDRPGTYTFYCNKWCSPNHWRMRGVIQAIDEQASAALTAHDPVIANLVATGVDIDAYLSAGGHGTAHPAAPATTAVRAPQPAAGAVLATRLTVPPNLHDATWRRSHTPREAEALLAAANPAADVQAIADTVAWLWVGNQATDQRDTAAALYAKNCAACHGDRGAGDGFAAAATTTAPPSLADSQRMAERRGDVLYAKIRRGGMGTGMPNFGTLFTSEETWDLVEYLWYLTYHE